MPALASGRVTAPGVTPDRWLVFLHGILGTRSNWRTFARQITAARPGWGALLVDLRLHGESQGFPPPHTVEAAARDVVDAIATLPGRAAAVLGHSFGGKVGIAVARQLEAVAPLEQLFLIDSNPGADPDARGSSAARHIVELLAGLPDEFPDRNAFTAWVEERGVSRPIAMWLAMNVRPITGTSRFVFRIDVPAVRAMTDDYFERDLWDVLERPEGGRASHIIAGGKSEVLVAADLERARRCPGATVDVIPEAGHWVHVDAPDELLSLVVGYLP